MSARFDRARVEAFLALVGERVDGEYLVVGGAAAAAWFEPARTTEDVDIFGLAGTQRERFALLELALDAGLPVEVISSTAELLVHRVAGWRDHIVVLHRGPRATIYRPDATLYLLLKLRRLSEVDLGDCLALIDHCDAQGEAIDAGRVRDALAALPPTDDAALRERRADLDARLALD